MNITPEHIRLLAEAQRDNPELDLLGVTDAGREWLRVSGGEWIEAGGKACKVRVRYDTSSGRTEMQCTHIDERIRGKKSTREARFKASNGWCVASAIEPELDVYGSEIFIRGRHADRDTRNVSCDGNHVAAIKFAVDAANAEWEKELAEVAPDKPSPGPELIALVREFLDKLQQAMKGKA